jgi:hypothetical protein
MRHATQASTRLFPSTNHLLSSLSPQVDVHTFKNDAALNQGIEDAYWDSEDWDKKAPPYWSLYAPLGRRRVTSYAYQIGQDQKPTLIGVVNNTNAYGRFHVERNVSALPNLLLFSLVPFSSAISSPLLVRASCVATSLPWQEIVPAVRGEPSILAQRPSSMSPIRASSLRGKLTRILVLVIWCWSRVTPRMGERWHQYIIWT